ncbi:hypothetical protein MRX96_052054 [Rhipicephalus microplus]
MNLDITSDDNFWSCLIGGLPYIMVRMGFDQMVVQRYMAARNLRSAKTIAITGAAFVLFFFLLIAIAAVYLIQWYRDCDPYVIGEISSYDQIVPYYIKTKPFQRCNATWPFLGRAASTVSSIVNAHAATFYIDVFGLYFKFSERAAVNVMRLLAFASGTIMTMFAVIVPMMGTATRLFLSLYAIGLGSIRWAHTARYIFTVGQCKIGKSFFTEAPEPAFVGTLDRCPATLNSTNDNETYGGITHSLFTSRSEVFPLYQLSFFWSSFIGALLTMILGTVLSIFTGGAQHCKDNLCLTSPLFLNLWRRFNFLGEMLQIEKERRNGDVTLLRNDENRDEKDQPLHRDPKMRGT